MADLTAEQKKVLDEQKANCPFCQIISGKIPAKKVYEDGKVIAILDINPARDGHILVMTKEHFPILPLMPKDQFDVLFLRLKDIIEKAKKGVLLCDSSNYFIANGGAAGQQSPHFMIHVIPRDPTDKFNHFEIKKKPVDEEKSRKLSMYMKANLPKLLGERSEKYKLKNAVPENKIVDKGSGLPEMKEEKRPEAPKGAQGEKSTGESQTMQLSKISKSDILKLLDDNPMLKDIILNAPQDAKEVIAENEKLKQIFSGFDIDELSSELKHPKKHDTKEIHIPEKKSEDKKSDDRKQDDKKPTNKTPDDKKSDDQRHHPDTSGHPENDTSEKDDDDDADLDLISRLF